MRNYVFIGEAGSGKTELAVNFALHLREQGEVHLFDMDMTKPLFRLRDLAESAALEGLVLHYQEQFMDAPTMVGGVNRLLRDESCSVVMDVGGDYIGARSLGGFAPLLNRELSTVYYVLNPYRPWSLELENIDGVLRQILEVSHIRPEQLRLVCNPNLGAETTAQDVLEGLARYELDYEFVCAREELCGELDIELPLFPIKLYMGYPW